MEHVYRTCSTDKLYNKDGSYYLTACGEDMCGPVESSISSTILDTGSCGTVTRSYCETVYIVWDILNSVGDNPL